MKLVDRAYVESHREEIVNAIKEGAVFIYPTDTIYGLGCKGSLVEKIKEIKKRESKPFSVIAPSKEWISEHCLATREQIDQYLPGPYTLFVNKKAGGTLGVRIPDHWFTPVIQEADEPFITTSVNLSGEPNMKKLSDVPQEILDAVDYVVYEGENCNEPSVKINLL